MKDPVFTLRKITPTTYVINGVGCQSYLLLGDERAVLIDSGMSHRNLKEFAQTITDLPIMGVINTHGHFDHTGGNGWFDTAYMHPYAATEANVPFETDISGGADDDYMSQAWPLDYEIKTLDEGEIVDLGSRRLEVIYIGAHSPGSIALLDLDERILFTGDELDPGQVLIYHIEGKPDFPCRTVENHQRNMRKLKARYDEFDFICPGHNGTPIHKSYINDFIIADQKIMDGAEGKKDISSPTMLFPYPDTARRFEYLGAHVCYSINSIFDEQQD